MTLGDNRVPIINFEYVHIYKIIEISVHILITLHLGLCPNKNSLLPSLPEVNTFNYVHHQNFIDLVMVTAVSKTG